MYYSAVYLSISIQEKLFPNAVLQRYLSEAQLLERSKFNVLA